MQTFESDRTFWKCAGEFPADKESVYPDHAHATGLDDYGVAGHRVLEYGCGGGSDAMSWARRGCVVHYCDIVAANVEAAARRISEHDLGHLAFPHVLSASDALPSGPFDVVSSHGVLHHVPRPASVLRAMRRVIRDSGRLVVMLYSPKLRESFEAEVRRLTAEHGISEEEAFGWCTDGRGCPRARSYSNEEARALFAETGFRWVESRPSNQGLFLTHHGVPA